MLPIIETTHLFPLLDQALFDLLGEMQEEDWKRPTVAGSWTTGDILLHLLDGNMRSIAMLRDGYVGVQPGKIAGYQDLLDFINTLNADWVKAMRRLSPAMVKQLLKETGEEYCVLMRSLDPMAPAMFSVAWAGEERSANWFHVAREYTEKWHHQQQIRMAMGKEAPLYTRAFYHPYLETSMRALPWHFRSFSGTAEAVLSFCVTGEAGGEWYLMYQEGSWQQIAEWRGAVNTRITIEPTMAWRCFTKGVDRETARASIQCEGDESVAQHLLGMLAVMA